MKKIAILAMALSVPSFGMCGAYHNYHSAPKTAGCEVVKKEAKERAPSKNYLSIGTSRVWGSICKIASLAKRDIGVKEGSRRANEMAKRCGMRSSVGRSNAWCAAAASEWIVSAGYDVKRSPSVSQLKYNLKMQGWKKCSTPTVGAVAFYKSRSHVGIVAAIEGGKVITVEGNSLNRVRESVSSVRSLEYWVRG